jgi:hypothetical protein
MQVKHALYRGGMCIFDAFSCTLTEKNPHGNGIREKALRWPGGIWKQLNLRNSSVSQVVIVGIFDLQIESQLGAMRFHKGPLFS